MKRRNLIAHIGAGSIVGIAGCLEDVETLGDPEDDTDAGTPDDPEDDNESEGEADTTNSEIDAQPCPPYETERDSAVCSHTVNPDAVSVYLEPDIESSTLKDGTPVDDITLTFYNQSSGELAFNPNSWNIWHNSGAEWKELQQELSGDGHLTVSADDTHSWSFMEAVESIQEEPALEPGLYAAELGVPDPKNSDDWIACIALIQLDPAE